MKRIPGFIHRFVLGSSSRTLLAALLQRAGADVTLRVENAGHALTDNTVEVVRRWLVELSK